MASLEAKFQPPEVIAAVDNPDDPLEQIPQLEASPQDHLPQTDHEEFGIKPENTTTQPLQQDLDLPPEAGKTVEVYRRKDTDERANIRPLAGGAPGKRDKRAKEEQQEVPIDRETARRTIEEFFRTNWDRKSKEGKREYWAKIKEINRIRQQHSDLYEEIFQSLRKN